MNNLETPPSPDDSKERRLEFINALQEELLSLVKNEEISVGEALGVMRRGASQKEDVEGGENVAGGEWVRW